MSETLDKLIDQMRGLNKSDSNRILSKLPAEQKLEVIKLLKRKPVSTQKDNEENDDEPKSNNKVFSIYSSWLSNLLTQSVDENTAMHSASFSKLTPSVQLLFKTEAIKITQQHQKNSKGQSIGFLEYILSLLTDGGVKK